MYLRFNFEKIYPAVFEIPRSQDFFTKNQKNFYQINNFEFRKKTKNSFKKFQKASFNSNWSIRQNIAGEAGDGDGTQNNTSHHFSKMGGR